MKGLTEQLDETGDQADLTPLIDCVFLLLLFFIVTTTFSEETNLFKVELPKAAHSEVRAITEEVILSISESGQYALGHDYVPDDQLWGKLSVRHQTEPIQTLIIQGDKSCAYEKVVMAMEVAQSLNIEEITLAVAPKE